jgi:hypothetical protein
MFQECKKHLLKSAKNKDTHCRSADLSINNSAGLPVEESFWSESESLKVTEVLPHLLLSLTLCFPCADWKVIITLLCKGSEAQKS